jgi:hypothetical protein
MAARTPTNIERFNLTALELFNRLYDAFPNPLDVDSQQLGLAASPEEATTVESISYILYAESAIDWLAEEGFIRYEAPKFGTTFRRARLTMQGLTVLGYLPRSVKESSKPQPVIARVKKVLANGAEKAGTEAVKGLMTEIFQLASPLVIQAAKNIGLP